MVGNNIYLDSWYLNKYSGYSHEDAICGPVYLHISFENYKGIFIGDSNNNKIVFKRMIPKIMIFFFFTVDGIAYFA